jgi:hypothetical protein
MVISRHCWFVSTFASNDKNRQKKIQYVFHYNFLNSLFQKTNIIKYSINHSLNSENIVTYTTIAFATK